MAPPVTALLNTKNSLREYLLPAHLLKRLGVLREMLISASFEMIGL
jgi:hypothetical protein